MSDRPWLIAVSLLFAALPAQSAVPPRKPKPATCRAEVIEGELTAGQDFSRPIGGGLRLWFEATAAGWILRVVPDHGPVGDHDYAELATPPYRSVTPLSVSTDFAFRAQDAVGWNPRRFRFATSAANFQRLLTAYQQVVDAGATPPAALEGQLSNELGRAAEESSQSSMQNWFLGWRINGAWQGQSRPGFPVRPIPWCSRRIANRARLAISSGCDIRWSSTFPPDLLLRRHYE